MHVQITLDRTLRLQWIDLQELKTVNVVTFSVLFSVFEVVFEARSSRKKITRLFFNCQKYNIFQFQSTFVPKEIRWMNMYFKQEAQSILGTYLQNSDFPK